MRALLRLSAVLTLTAAALAAGPGAPVAPPFAVHTDVDAATLTKQGPAVWQPSDYDGVALTKDAPDADALPKVHGVYIHASDRPSRFAEYAGYFQAEQRRASAFLTSATGMAFRWDERTASDGRVLHDITVVRSKSTFNQLSGSRGFSLIGDALRTAKLTHPDKKYYVWLDATSETLCGQGQGAYDSRRAPDNAAERSTYSVSYRPLGAEEKYAAGGGWCNPVIHELSHNLGAVASHMPGYLSGGHCDDDGQDIMCNASAGPQPYDPEAPRTYDFGDDDYLDPAADLALDSTATLPWWTVNLSRFLCPRSAANRAAPDCTSPNRPVY